MSVGSGWPPSAGNIHPSVVVAAVAEQLDATEELNVVHDCVGSPPGTEAGVHETQKSVTVCVEHAVVVAPVAVVAESLTEQP